jgi:hypothetical protein
MKPFDDYPNNGKAPLPIPRGTNCRRGYGLDFMRITKQTRCAYCDEVDFTASYRAWLEMTLDHVVPVSVCKERGIPISWRDSSSNRVLACAACNSFRNRYRPSSFLQAPDSFQAFLEIRDSIFLERKTLIAKAHQEDRAFFGERPWESKKRKT